MKKFTKKQFGNWIRYELVRLSGKWNMYDPNARRETGLTNKEYSFVMKNYSELKLAFEQLNEKQK